MCCTNLDVDWISEHLYVHLWSVNDKKCFKLQALLLIQTRQDRRDCLPVLKTDFLRELCHSLLLIEGKYLRVSISTMMGALANSEKEDANLLYSAADGNGRKALQLYRECFRKRRMRNNKIFTLMHRHFCEKGTFSDCTQIKLGRTRTKIVRHQNMRNKLF